MCKTCLATQLLLILLLNLGALNVELGFVVGCHEVEREALLKFKKSLVQLNDSLSSWEGMTCCNWEGVGCDKNTAYVNRLDLRNPYCNPFSDDPPSLLVSPKLDHALVELKHMNYLDLSCNHFQFSQIPGFIGSFKHLRYLNLSSSNFSGVVPSQLGNLSRLQNLDLSDNYYFMSSDIRWASKLVSLQYLNMNSVNITVSRNAMHELTMPPSLLGLRLSSCFLGNPQLYSLVSNSTWLSRIQQLDLSKNYLEGPLPRVFPNMTSLTYLTLDFNNFNGSIPLWMRNMTKLEYLSLVINSFSGIEGQAVMGILGNLCKLKTFDLSHNNIRGSLGASHNFSKCASYALETLQLADTMIGGIVPSWLDKFKNLRILDVSMSEADISDNSIVGHIPLSIRSLVYLEELHLSNNHLTGTLPDCLGELRALRILDVSYNRISGHIPTPIGNLSSLEKLVLSHNSLNGSIPESLGGCKSLVYIDLSSNSLQGVVSESHFANLSRLDHLDMSYNPLDLNFNPEWSPPFQMSYFCMTSCKIRSQFPHWIGNQTKLTELDLSDNMITGKLVQWFSSTQLYNINISYNQITGPVPYFSSSAIMSIDFSNNMISGPLLHDGSSAKNDIVGTPVCELPNLWFIDLQRNKIVGTIPDCWGNSDFLQYINLSFNNLSGNIPKSIGLLPNLAILNLNNNSLQGPIPSTFIASMSTALQILDLGENKLVGDIPIRWSKETFPVLKILRLRGNQLVGGIPPKLCTLPNLHSIDLAHNILTGRIPRCFGHLICMKSVPYEGDCSINDDGPIFSSSYVDSPDDITTVVLKGAELQYTTTLKYVVNLDLSCNALVGSIPEEMTNLSALIGLNLSHNHLTGNIPIKIGEMRSLHSLDLSNNNLSEIIPSSMSTLTFLSNLNLSDNNLHGQIPTGRQLQTLNNPSAYQGNPGLCGDPLPDKCNPGHEQNKPQLEQEPEKEDSWGKPLFYFVIFSRFATGFWGVVRSLLLKRRFRFALFHLMDRITDYFYVQVMVRINRRRN